MLLCRFCSAETLEENVGTQKEPPGGVLPKHFSEKLAQFICKHLRRTIFFIKRLLKTQLQVLFHEITTAKYFRTVFIIELLSMAASVKCFSKGKSIMSL